MAAKYQKTISLIAPDDELLKGVTSLTMRPPRAKDKLAVSQVTRNEVEAEILVFASLCEVGRDVIENLEECDYQALQIAYSEFAAGKHRAETQSSAGSKTASAPTT